MRATITPATAEDFRTIIGHAPTLRARLLAARLDGEVIGIGGFVYKPDGTVWASMLATPRGREFPAAVFRAGVLAMRHARRLGLTQVFASPDPGEPAAERFLARLGFARIGEADGEIIFCWRCPGTNTAKK